MKRMLVTSVLALFFILNINLSAQQIDTSSVNKWRPITWSPEMKEIYSVITTGKATEGTHAQRFVFERSGPQVADVGTYFVVFEKEITKDFRIDQLAGVNAFGEYVGPQIQGYSSLFEIYFSFVGKSGIEYTTKGFRGGQDGPAGGGLWDVLPLAAITPIPANDTVRSVRMKFSTNFRRGEILLDNMVFANQQYKVMSVIDRFGDVDITDAVEDQNLIPSDFSLSQNYPNPFNPITTIQYSVSKTSKIQINVFDVLGRQVAELVNGEKSPGTYSIQFNGSDFSSGIYLYTLKSKAFSVTKKMLLLK